MPKGTKPNIIGNEILIADRTILKVKNLIESKKMLIKIKTKKTKDIY